MPAGVLPVRRSALPYMERGGSSCSCDHLRRVEEPEGVGGDALEALRLPGREEWERDRFAEDEARDEGRSGAAANERLSTESR